MPSCDVCGRDSDSLKSVRIDQAVLRACEACQRYGKVLEEKAVPRIVLVKPAPVENVIVNTSLPTQKYTVKRVDALSSDSIVNARCASLVSEARQRRGLTQEDMAKQLNERESLIHAIEQGRRVPDLQLARKIGAFLNVKLLEELK